MISEVHGANKYPAGSRRVAREVSLATALTPTVAERTRRLLVEGDFVSAWTNGTLTGVYLTFNHPTQDTNDRIYLDREPVIHYPERFESIYVGSEFDQAGKTLYLSIGGQYSSQPSGAGAVGSNYRLNTIRSDKDTHFTEAIAQNAKEDENIAGLLSNNIRITKVAIQSDQQLDYRLIFWATDQFDNTDLDVDDFMAEREMDLTAYGFRIAGANQWYMELDNLGIQYSDDDATHELHISLQNLSATGKNAGATGEVVVEITYELR